MDKAGFKPGDVVKLKSGGQAMTVAEVDEEGEPGNGPFPQVFCVWMSDGRLCENWLSHVVLTAY